jgi:hypothetical protein
MVSLGRDWEELAGLAAAASGVSRGDWAKRGVSESASNSNNLLLFCSSSFMIFLSLVLHFFPVLSRSIPCPEVFLIGKAFFLSWLAPADRAFNATVFSSC